MYSMPEKVFKIGEEQQVGDYVRKKYVLNKLSKERMVRFLEGNADWRGQFRSKQLSFCVRGINKDTGACLEVVVIKLAI